MRRSAPSPAKARLGLAVAVLLAACQASAKPPPAPVRVLVLKGRYTIAVPTRGLSGLAAGPDGGLWAVAERERLLVRLKVGDSGVIPEKTVPLAGIDDALDTEALAVLAGGAFLIGTESLRPRRTSDRLLEARLVGGRAEVTRSFDMPYALWKTRGEINKGIEGLCAAGDVVLAGAEIVIEDSGRWAPVGRLDLASGSWTPFRLLLSSDTGRLSSLACRRRGDLLEALGVERHYGVARLHFFTISATGPGADVTAGWVGDLGAAVPGIPNMEGIEWLADGSMVVFIDNDTGGVKGPNEVVRVTAP